MTFYNERVSLKYDKIQKNFLVFYFDNFAFYLFPSSGKTLKVYIFHRPPLYIAKGNKIGGIIVDISKQIFEKAGIKYRFIVYPPKRILITLKREKNACSLGWFKTKPREENYVFSKPIYCEGKTLFLVARKNSPNNPKFILNSPRKSIVLIQGFSYGESVDKLLRKSPVKKLKITGSTKQLLLIVLNKRADCTILSKNEVKRYFDKYPLFSKKLKAIPLSEKEEIHRYIIFSKNTDKEIIEKINKAIEETVKVN